MEESTIKKIVSLLATLLCIGVLLYIIFPIIHYLLLYGLLLAIGLVLNICMYKDLKPVIVLIVPTVIFVAILALT